MPYKSDAQRRFMHAKLPHIAKRWDRKYYGQGGNDMPAGNPQAYMDQGMSRKRAINLAMKKAKQNNGRRVGRNLTPGVPRRVGPRRVGPNSGPPMAGRQSYQSWKKHGFIDDTPGPNPPKPKPRPLPPGELPDLSEHGVRGRMNALHDKSRRNNQRALQPLLRMYTRAKEGKQFGGYVFGENKGNTTEDFLKAIKSHTQGTGLYKLFNRQINPKTKKPKPKPKPMPLPEPEVPAGGNDIAARIKKATNKSAY